MIREISLDRLQQSGSAMARSYTEGTVDASCTGLSNLFLDVKRKGESGSNASTRFIFKEFNQYNGPASGTDIPDEFRFFLESIFSKEDIDKLNNYSQNLISLIQGSILEAVTSVYIGENCDFTTSIKFQSKARIFKKNGNMYLENRVSQLQLHISDVQGAKQILEVPGTAYTRFRFNEDRAFFEKCIVDTALLERFLLEKPFEKKADFEALIPGAKNELKMDQYLKTASICLSNTIYALKLFCEGIKSKNPEDSKLGMNLHAYLEKQHKAIFKNAKVDPQECCRIIDEVRGKLKEANKWFSRFPGWKNVASAMTILGGLAMIVKGVYTKVRYNQWNPCLFKTGRVLDRSLAVERMLNDVQSRVAAPAA